MRLVDGDDYNGKVFFLTMRSFRNQWSKKCVNFYEITPDVT